MGWPLTLNVVLHRLNIDRIGRILDLAAEVGADRIELANTQYYGWAWHNRAELLPSRAQLERAEVAVRAAHERLKVTDGDHLRHPRLLQPVPQAVHGRLGAAAAHRGTQRRRAALPDRARPAAAARQRARAPAGLDLGEFAAVPGVSAERTGCRTRAAAASAGRWTSAGAGARRSCSPATRGVPIRCAIFLPITRSWPARCRRPTRWRGRVRRSLRRGHIHGTRCARCRGWLGQLPGSRKTLPLIWGCATHL